MLVIFLYLKNVLYRKARYRVQHFFESYDNNLIIYKTFPASSNKASSTFFFFLFLSQMWVSGGVKMIKGSCCCVQLGTATSIFILYTTFLVTVNGDC